MSIVRNVGRHAEILDRSEKANDFVMLAKAMAHRDRAFIVAADGIDARGDDFEKRHQPGLDRRCELVGVIRLQFDCRWLPRIASQPFSLRYAAERRHAEGTVEVEDCCRNCRGHGQHARRNVGEAHQRNDSRRGRDCSAEGSSDHRWHVRTFPLGSKWRTTLRHELRNGVAVATDTSFLSSLYSGVTPVASAGSTTANVLTDLSVLLSALTLGANSRLFFVASSANIAKLMLKVSSGSGVAFPLLAPTGGQILNGITAIASDALPAGAVLMVDATGLAGNSELPELRAITQGDVQFSTTPDLPPAASTIWHSMWQHNERALMVERWFGFAQVRTGTVAAISGATY